MLEKIALQKKLITGDDFNKAISLCKSAENYEDALKDHFISSNLISAEKVEQLLRTVTAVKIIRKNMRFGEVAEKLGFIDKKILQAALKEQKMSAAKNKQPKLIGKILFESGKLTKKQIMLIIKEQKKTSLKIKAVGKNNALEQKKIKSILTETNEPEEKKSKSSERITGGMLLEIDKTALSAYLLKTDEFNDSIIVEDIYTILAGKMIRFGLANEQMVDRFIKSSGFKKKYFKVASGTAMVQGTESKIEYYFDTDYLNAGGVDEEGNIDFKDRGEIPKIEENTLLAEKLPLKKSKNGRDIFGNELEALPIKDVELKTQTGAYLSEDDTKLYAAISGYPKLTWSGNINVLDEFVVKGDVGYETGHVSYEGNIEIKGCLKSSFRIKGHDVKVMEIDGGKIRADGDVMILNGINAATIYSRGHVSVKFVHNSNIFCLGNLYVEKEIVDSKIETSGGCLIGKGEIINSQIASNNGVQTKNLGTQRTHPNIIKVGQDMFLDNELKAIDKKIDTIKKEIDKQAKRKTRLKDDNARYHQTTLQTAIELEKFRDDGQKIKAYIDKATGQSKESQELKELKSKLKQNISLFNRLDKELNDSFDIIDRNEAKILNIDTKFIEFEEQLDDLDYEKVNFTDWGKANTGNPAVIADGKVCSDTIIIGKHSQKKLEEEISRVNIKEVVLKNDGKEYGIYEIQIHDNIKRR